jgi:YesN/AraC family two-component response regulator
LKLPVTAGLGGGADRLGELPEAYRKAQIALQSRIVYGGNRVIPYAGHMADADIRFRYPIETEARFEQALQLGDRAEAERALADFSAAVRDSFVQSELMRSAYYQLLTTSLRTAYMLGIRPDDLLAGGKTDPYAAVGRLRTVQELDGWFAETLIRPIADFVQGRHRRENERLIGKVVQFIETNYGYDLSLDQCAELCGLSPHYLSRLFKKQVGVSFIDFLTNCRVTRAKELLRKTELSVAEIADQVGYQPKNFIRVFKKATELTPGQFRELRDA